MPSPLPGRVGGVATRPPTGGAPPSAASAPRRTARQRTLLAIGSIASIGVLLAATFVGWGAFKLSSIDREDLALDLPTGAAKNYLIVGSDSRARGHPKRGVTAPIEDRRPLADTIMVLRIDPSSPRPVLLSLPRDLWVTRAGDQQKGRINAAYGEGAQSLVDTLRDELGIPIHHYIEVDFKGFESIVDAIGGVPMWFDRPMRDWQSDLDIEEGGCVVLDGYDALAFARSRHMQVKEGGRYRFDGTGDLGRISRQQFFIRLTIDRALSKAGRNPLTIKRLIESGTDNVTLDDSLALTDLVRIGNKFSGLKPEDLTTYTLPTRPRTTTGGASVLEIDRRKAAEVLARFRGADDPDPFAEASSLDPSTVSLSVMNSSGSGGAARTAAQALGAAGFDVVAFGNGAALGHASAARSEIVYRPELADEAAAVAWALVSGADLVEDPTVTGAGLFLFLGADYAGVAAPTTTTTTTTLPVPTELGTPPEVLVLDSSGVSGTAAAAAADLVTAGFRVPLTGDGADLGRPREARTLVRFGPGATGGALLVASRLAAGPDGADVAEDVSLGPGAVVVFLGADYAGVEGVTDPAELAARLPASTTTSSTTTTTTTALPSSKAVGELPLGTPPDGTTCG